MTEQTQTRKSPWERITGLWHTFADTIRLQIVLPYLLLTVIVGGFGIYVVTELLSRSLDERLDSYLGESARTLVSSWRRYDEDEHMDAARRILVVSGVLEAIRDQDDDALHNRVKTMASTQNLDTVLFLDAQGDVLVHYLREGDQFDRKLFSKGGVQYANILQGIIDENDPRTPPKHAIGRHPLDEQNYYYFTAAPIEYKNEMIGVIMMGSRLSKMIPDFQTNVLSQITIYSWNGQAIYTTFSPVGDQADDQALLSELSISPDIYQRIEEAENLMLFEDIENQRIQGQIYRLAYGAVQVGSESFGVYSVALPRQFVQEAGEKSRTNYIIIFSVGSVFVIVLGFFIATRITNPLHRLVMTSLAVAQGDLRQRTGIQRSDEVGVLARTFDQMTFSLEERTFALEQALYAQRETASRMRAILSSIGDGVLLEDLDGNIIPMNEAARTMLGDMAEQFRYGPLRELSVAEQKSDPEEPPSPWLLESRRFQLADKVFVAHSAVVRMEGEGQESGQKLGTVIVIRDVTAEVEAEKLKDAFVAHVSHELRTPLTSIKGYSDLLLATTREVLEASQRTFLEKIVLQTGNMISMVNALLDFTEIEAGGRLTLQQQPFQISELIADIAEEWDPKMEDQELDFVVETPDQSCPLVNIDQKRMRWAILNLVRNAWQYTPAGGDVTLRVVSHPDRVSILVEDTGIGMPEEAQRNLFTRFFRVMHQHDDDVRGLGLGLYVTKAIVEAHGGYIQVVSKVDQGSTFSIILPTMQAQALTTPPPENV